MKKGHIAVYGNEIVTDTLTSMIKSERLSHAFVLYGNKGLGKKTLARYIAMQILCSETDAPCCECKSCRMIMDNQHPDVKWISADENKGFSVQSLRATVLDAYVKPNEGDRKIYIFTDCENMLPTAQNTLLKLIEEPPEQALFIFTASSKSAFLPTIISRVISLGVTEVTEEECRKALADKGVNDEDRINQAISAFRGNIGMCLDYLSGEELQQDVNIARNITDCILSGSEYNLLKAIYSLDSKKDSAKTTLFLLSDIIRDSCVARAGSNIMTGCYSDGSQRLSKVITQQQLFDIYSLLIETVPKIDGYANLSLTLTGICSQIKDILNY